MLWFWITLGVVAYFGIGAIGVIFGFDQKDFESQPESAVFVLFFWPFILCILTFLAPWWGLRKGLIKAIAARERADKRREKRKEEKTGLTKRLEERAM